MNKSKGAGKEIGENWDKWNCAKPSFEKKSSWGNEKGECQGDDKSLDHNQSLGGQTEAPKWNASNSVSGNWTTDWNKGPAANEGPSQSWGGGSKSNMEKASTGDATGSISGTCGVASGWGSKSSWCGSKFSGQKSDEIGKESENKDQDGWNGGRALSGGLAKGWGQSASLRSGSNDTGGPTDANWECKNHDSDWAKNGGTSSGTGDSCGKDSSWGKRSNWNSGSNDADGNQDSGWGKENNFTLNPVMLTKVLVMARKAAGTVDPMMQMGIRILVGARKTILTL
ncbi:hypothetical protein GH714_033117 [Hevea brasiliensis]|uniref:Uncharacterized protein n=1 Tax=Hevea brasiliensis TaxID=3981 RepID=A0A6A6L3J7_HEVBR|nr:hypothetical protein GH714_033117 [Hevea brasiliensis]